MVKPSCVVFRRGATHEHARVLKFLRGEIPPRDLAEALQIQGATLEAPNESEADWQLEDAGTVSLLRKLQQTSGRLGTVCSGKMFRGVVTGLNEVFIIDSETRQRLIAEHESTTEIVHPYLQGTHLRTWYQETSDDYLIFARRGIQVEKYPAVLGYLSSFKHRLEPRSAEWKPTAEEPRWRGRKEGNYKWYEIQDAIDYYPSFGEPKIVWPDIAKLPRCSMDLEGRFVGDTAFCIPIEDYYLLGVLNSWPLWFVISKTAPPLRLRAGRWQYRCKRRYMAELPIPDAPSSDRDAIASLAKQCCDQAKESNELVTSVCYRFHASFGDSTKPRKLSTRLEEWPKLGFPELGDELRKVYAMPRKPWGDPDLADIWEPYILSRKKQWSEQLKSISDAERGINRRVFRLFGLTNNEIQLLQTSVSS